MTFAVWVSHSEWLEVKNELLEAIRERFDAEGVEIPFPHLSLYKGEATEPIPVKLVASEAFGVAGGSSATEGVTAGISPSFGEEETLSLTQLRLGPAQEEEILSLKQLVGAWIRYPS